MKERRRSLVGRVGLRFVRIGSHGNEIGLERGDRHFNIQHGLHTVHCFHVFHGRRVRDGDRF
jgi:hypothetical protein